MTPDASLSKSTNDQGRSTLEALSPLILHLSTSWGKVRVVGLVDSASRRLSCGKSKRDYCGIYGKELAMALVSIGGKQCGQWKHCLV